jgi:hypothetical protein
MPCPICNPCDEDIAPKLPPVLSMTMTHPGIKMPRPVSRTRPSPYPSHQRGNGSLCSTDADARLVSDFIALPSGDARPILSSEFSSWPLSSEALNE